jgi:hypothetical protein
MRREMRTGAGNKSKAKERVEHQQKMANQAQAKRMMTR